jgi:hypothetical protein
MPDPFSTGPLRPWDFGRCFNDATDVLTKNIWILLLAGLLSEVLGAVTLLIFVGPLSGGMAVMTLRALRRRDRVVEFGDLFAAFPHRFGTLVLLFFFELLCMLLGFILCIIPMFVLMTWWLHTQRIVMEKDVGVFEALSLSKQLVTESGFWLNLGLGIVLLLILVGATSIPCIGVLLGWIATSYCTLVASSAYLQQTGDAEYAAAR